MFTMTKAKMRLRVLITLLACLLVTPVFAAADPARFAQGLAAFDAGRYEEAYKIFVSIAHEDIAATRNVGVMLRKGLGVEKDPHGAQLWLARAAKGGLFSAAADLGEMLLDGEADKPNPKAAFGWLAMAAQEGYPTAAYRLAGLYEAGLGTEKDIEAARRLYAFAKRANIPGAKEKLAALPPPAPEEPGAVEITPARTQPATVEAASAESPAEPETTKPEPETAPAPSEEVSPP